MSLGNILTKVYRKDLLGIRNYALYYQTYWGTKHLIHNFMEEVLHATLHLRDSELTATQKLTFFNAANQALGRSALCLSGGGSFGYFHFGVVRALLNANCLPQIISGTSAGAMVAAWTATRTDEELEQVLNPSIFQYLTPCEESVWVKLQRLYEEGVIFDLRKWAEKTKVATLGDTTFLEAYQKTKRVLCVVTASLNRHHPYSVLNYITSPNVVIWSAVLASASMPRFLKPCQLFEKLPTGELVPYHFHGTQHGDGSLKMDLPMEELAQMFNVRFFIVSQVNPVIAPYFFWSRGSSGKPSPRSKGSSGWRGGFILSSLEKVIKLDMQKWLKLLADMDLSPDVHGQDIRYLFLQKVEGDVTIIPSLKFSDFLHLVSDPGYKDMESYIRRGELATWPCILHIQSFLRLEQVLRECLLSLQEKYVDKKESN